MSYIQNAIQTKFLGSSITNPGSSVNLFTFNLKPGQSYKLTGMIFTALFQPAGENSFTYSFSDSGVGIAPQNGIVISKNITAAGGVAGPVMGFSRFVTMDSLGTGVLTMAWDTYTLNGTQVITNATSYMTVEECTQRVTTDW